ncbi:assimilatory sulfite reductase (NADPH) flavoprotein subunit [Neobacillus jeddahensis]|uniref:assimilatory sulfite reductase (NADPH) flavoprotein subunit n=1 Tax=Neobacillus jeddahensis TaxID=1461580 RepID=UPI00058F9CC6|nr:assimilatory sulfite reductase (NADPH) flavoprotein subunit [Neobacillus jeddahensis]
MQLQVLNSPFTQEQVDLLNSILPTLSESQKVWLSGFLAGSQFSSVLGTATAQLASQLPAQNSNQAKAKDITILYGSQTGNAQGLAKKSAKTLEGNGFNVTVASMSDFKQNQLKKVQNLLIIVSTHGEGDPPDSAIIFHEFLFSKRAPKLNELHFSVLALGDSSYEFFCQTGKEFDARLEELGGTRLYPRFDCDVDFDEPAAEWLEGVLGSLGEAGGTNPTPLQAVTNQTVESVFSRTNPFKAEVLENLNLNGRGSNKETRHLELSLEGSGLIFEPGDSLGVYPENDPELVDLLIKQMNWNSEERITVKKDDVRSLRDVLLSYFEITVLTKPLLQKALELSDSKELQDLLAPGNEQQVKEYLNGRDILDLVRDFTPWSGTAQEFVSILRKIPSRLYSIASSLTANPEEVHLTIGAVRYDAHGRKRNGVCSILAAERLNPGDILNVYVQQNENFKLPANPETPIIMIGPGTGVAPFRAFMQEREEVGKQVGKSWLFFGDQHFVTDFLYQIEWQKWLKNGILTKMDVAFSRDTAEKVYVQHRMLEHSKELFEWLQEGAAVYICGDEKHMAHDVHQTLVEIIEKEARLSREDAEAYLADMQQQKRYQRDVY